MRQTDSYNTVLGENCIFYRLMANTMTPLVAAACNRSAVLLLSGSITQTVETVTAERASIELLTQHR